MSSQSEAIFEKLKLTKSENDLLDDLRVEIKDIIKKELESLQTSSTCFTTNHITGIESLKRGLNIKECTMTQLLNIYRKYNTECWPIFTCENETKANNISGMKTNQSERERSIDVTSNGNIVING